MEQETIKAIERVREQYRDGMITYVEYMISLRAVTTTALEYEADRAQDILNQIKGV